MRFVVQLLVNAAAIWFCAWLLDGISLAPPRAPGRRCSSSPSSPRSSRW
ncbi:hypothetical protein [Georgenia sp. SUBG003]